MKAIGGLKPKSTYERKMTMKNTTTKKASANKKLLPAAGSLLISAAMLGTSTYAWFTMNKEVKVTGMEVKAHAEEGLLINEVAAAASNTWDDIATGGASQAVVLRPSSTYDLVTWWHANSKLSADEAGIDNLSGTVVDSSGNKYVNVTAGETGVEDNVVVGPVGGEGTVATGNTRAETHVYYRDASFGDASGTSYDDGEGFYVKYTYYLKSSGDADLTVSNLRAMVKATKNAGSSDDLDPCLRVGIAIPINSSSSTIAGYNIFSPIPGTSGSGATNESYGVTKNATGTSTETVSPVVASSTGTFTAYAKVNTSSSVTIPKVTSDGIPVYVYVWFEGEDTHCMSDNLTDALAAYDIDVQFYDADIY
jgi:hypothetical protein